MPMKLQLAAMAALTVAFAGMMSPAIATAEIVDVQEECVPFRVSGNVFHQRCTSYAIHDDGTREVTGHYNCDENGMIYDP
ncbi:hypothetical protein JY440_06805 [Stenotrophomonas maltophilia]|uniref:Transmembrane protein n=2 Tax=Stenotrophomonas TaxID=40323 RepID=A0AB34TCX3_STEMA|nr:hypothetical protein VL23_20665 [Stenotrophomonas maltophilia]MBH1541345.1 hypothetical protein [Stenotrophomonas maltophilia]MBN4982914.1 hypothetical protein [Stenotrophomonas maltophilia]